MIDLSRLPFCSRRLNFSQDRSQFEDWSMGSVDTLHAVPVELRALCALPPPIDGMTLLTQRVIERSSKPFRSPFLIGPSAT